MSSTTRWLATGKIDGAASIAGAWCACCARRAIASVALTLAASPGFGVYVTYSYLLTSRNPLILQRILDGWLATVSHESARSAKMALILAGVWLLVDYPLGPTGPSWRSPRLGAITGVRRSRGGMQKSQTGTVFTMDI
jgi:hypothetical protein